MKDEYISKQQALDELFCERCTYAATRVIKNIPPADVAPVVHGEWKSNGLGGYAYVFVCSQCGYVDGYPFNDRHKFCPNCGAKIDEKIPPERQTPASIYKCPGCGARFALSTKQMGGYFCHFCGAEMYKEEAKV